MQSPKSVLFRLGSVKHMAEQIRQASMMADTFDAQVTAQACRTSVVLRYPFITEYAADTIAILEEMSRHERERLYEAFTQNTVEAPRVRWAEPIEDGLYGFTRCALYADLLILGQYDPEDASDDELSGSSISSLLVQSGRPAVVLPYAGSWPDIGRSVLIAWKETPEAARAVSTALPWLLRAREVHAISYGSDAQASLSKLRDSLHVRGVASVTLHSKSAEESDICNSLLSSAADIGSDLLVMGCYVTLPRFHVQQKVGNFSCMENRDAK